MTVREKIYGAMAGHAPLLALLAEGEGSIRQGGSLVGRIDARPFIVYRIQERFPTLRGDDAVEVLHTNVEIWVYDEPGSFTRIEAILDVTMALVPTIVGLKSIFRGVSGELPDDEMKAFTKNVVYECSERT